jgi:transcriptional regulator with PAS, ATPase and Fis domain
MDHHSWVEEFGAGVTVCDTEGIIVEMNDRSARMFKEQGGRGLLGSNVLDCHPEPSRTKLKLLMGQRQASTYTTERAGRRKLIHQAPWYRGGEYAGFVEIVLALPDAMPHFIRGSAGPMPHPPGEAPARARDP